MGMLNKRGLKLGLGPSSLSLREFHEKRNKVVILRQIGGLGDILMHRMMFEDFKRVYPDAEIVFACPKRYHKLARNHPYIDEVISAEDVDTRDYLAVYNTSTVCGRYESQMAPFAEKHRSDIWANHCGVELQNHNMHINLREEAIEKTKKIVKDLTDKPNVLFLPVSAMKSKNLEGKQVIETVEELRKMGLFVFGCHTGPIAEFDKAGVPTLQDLNVEEWAALISAADYILTVDTAAFHLAGGLGKPMTGVFAWTDGKVYGKYFDFILVQKHRDNGNWDCGPCYLWCNCPKEKISKRKPCITEITTEMIIDGVKQMLEKWPKT